MEKGELKQAMYSLTNYVNMKFQERFVEIREKLKIQISRNLERN